MTKLNIYLNFPGNTEEVFEFYRSIFGGEFTPLVRFKDMPVEGMNIPEADQDKIMHVSLPIGDSTLMGTDALESLGQSVTPGNNTYVSVHPDSREEADRIFTALSQGAEIEMPIADQVWGDYYGSLVDKFGTRWMVNHTAQAEG